MRLASGAYCLAVLLLVACSSAPGSPARPAGVPASAMWIGGVDGGVFAELEPTGTPGIYRARVFADGTGTVLYSGSLRLDPPGGSPPDVADSGVFVGWDGTRLLLADGRSLTR